MSKCEYLYLKEKKKGMFNLLNSPEYNNSQYKKLGHKSKVNLLFQAVGIDLISFVESSIMKLT